MSTTQDLDAGHLSAGPQVALSPLYLANLVCSMGMMGFVALAGSLAATLGLEAWQIGISAMAGGLGWVLSARSWGRAADTLGRKRVLTYGVGGFAVAYGLMCLSAQAGAAWGVGAMLTLTGLIATRFLAGVFYSAVPAAGNALIADHFQAAERAGAMGRLSAAQAAGLLFGPALIAVAAGPSPVLPLFILAVLPVGALAFLSIKLQSDTARTSDRVPPLPFGDKRLLGPLVIAFAAMVSIGIAQIVVGFVALDRLSLPNAEAIRVSGLTLSAVGVALIVANIAIGKIGWSPAELIGVGGMLSAFGFVASSLAPSASLFIASYALAGFGAGWVMPSISAAAANAVDASEQGRAAGSVSTAFGIGAIVGPFLGGSLYSLNQVLPLLLSACAMGAAAIIGAQLKNTSTA